MAAAVFLLLLLAFLRTTHELAPANTLTIHHASAGTTSKSWEDMVAGDAARLLYLTSLAGGGGRTFVPIASGRQTPLYTPNYVVRAPPHGHGHQHRRRLGPLCRLLHRRLPHLQDLPCGAPHRQQVPNPICSAAMACSYNLTYSGASFAADLTQDTLTLSGDSFPSYTFACLRLSATAADAEEGGWQEREGEERGGGGICAKTKNNYAQR